MDRGLEVSKSLCYLIPLNTQLISYSHTSMYTYTHTLCLLSWRQMKCQIRGDSFQAQVSGVYASSHKSSSQFGWREEKGRWQRGKLHLSAKPLSKAWLSFHFSVCSSVLPIWPFMHSMICFIQGCDCNRFVEYVKHLFPLVSVSLSVY